MEALNYVLSDPKLIVSLGDMIAFGLVMFLLAILVLTANPNGLVNRLTHDSNLGRLLMVFIVVLVCLEFRRQIWHFVSSVLFGVPRWQIYLPLALLLLGLLVMAIWAIAHRVAPYVRRFWAWLNGPHPTH